MLDNYLINENTLAIIPIKENKTKVIEKFISYYIKKNSIDILDDSCKFYGSSFLGRCQSSKYLTGINYKCPIIISEVKNIIMFPTASYRNDNCTWISYNSVESYHLDNNKLLKINLINSGELRLKMSENIFSNQLFKASRLDSIMKSKKY